jgi:hypothetical protein
MNNELDSLIMLEIHYKYKNREHQQGDVDSANV